MTNSAAETMDYQERNRRQAGARLAKRGGVHPLGERVYKVRSTKSDNGRVKYTVSLGEDPIVCACKDFRRRHQPCKHMWAVRAYEEYNEIEGSDPVAEKRQPVDLMYQDARRSFLNPDPQKAREHDRAYMRQDKRTIELAIELTNTLKNVVGIKARKAGHPETALNSKLLCMVLKVMWRRSTRVMYSVVEDLIEQDRIDLDAPLHRNSYNNFFKDPAMTAILEDLLLRTTRPARKIETKFAVDSTGFSTVEVDNWIMSDKGKESLSRRTVWLKLHAMVGVETRLITAYRLTSNEGIDEAGDSTNFLPLLRHTAETFKIAEVLGDGAYSGDENQKAVLDLGAHPYMPVKKNFKAETKTFLTREEAEYIYDLQYKRRPEFDSRYTKRAVVEGVFSSLKRLNDSFTWCRGEVQRRNEIICKLIAHNLRQLVKLEVKYGDDIRFNSDTYFQPRKAA